MTVTEGTRVLVILPDDSTRKLRSGKVQFSIPVVRNGRSVPGYNVMLTDSRQTVTVAAWDVVREDLRSDVE